MLPSVGGARAINAQVGNAQRLQQVLGDQVQGAPQLGEHQHAVPLACLVPVCLWQPNAQLVEDVPADMAG